MQITFIPLPIFDGTDYCVFCKTLVSKNSQTDVPLYGGVVCQTCRSDMIDTVIGNGFTGYLLHMREQRKKRNEVQPQFITTKLDE